MGSGQFGQVYGGICKSNNQQVAIKIIDKTRFKNQKEFQEETNVFQNEITLLYNVDHPGIVRLYSLFDEVDNVGKKSYFSYDIDNLSNLYAKLALYSDGKNVHRLVGNDTEQASLSPHRACSQIYNLSGNLMIEIKF